MSKILQSILDWFTSIFSFVLGFLPDSPFQFSANSEFRQYAGYLNYFVPIGSFIIILTGWLAAIAIYYAYSTVLRIIKTIE